MRHGSEDGATVAMAWCCVPGRGRYSPLVAPRVPPTPTCTAPAASTAAHAPKRRPLLLLLAVAAVVASLTSSVQAYGMSTHERTRYRTAYACEGSTMNMECDPGHVINLIRANYGRFSITICNEHGNTEWSVNCMSARSHRVLHDKCTQRQNCSVAASTRGFGDPCPGTLKYLEAHYQCVPVDPPQHTARPRPHWFITTKTTVSSITEDDPLLPAPPTKISPASGGGGGGGASGRPVTDGVEREGGLGVGVEGGAEGGDGTGVVSSVAHVVGADLGNRLKGTPAEDLPQTTTSTTTTTTLRPPPWLITNTTKNTTTSTTTSSTTSTTTSTAKPSSSTTSTTARPDTNLEPPAVPSEGGSDDGARAKDEHDFRVAAKGAQDSDADKVSTTTISTTTVWSPRAEVPATEVGVPISEASWCPPSSGRGLFWNWTQGGEVAVQPCPGGASGWARRPCNPLGWAGPADLSECRSVWLTTLTSRAHTNDAVLAVAHDLATVTGSRALYGGDVTATARLLNSLARRMADDVSNFPDRDQREALVTELVGAAIATGSHLVGGQRDAWADLRPPEHRAAATALLLGLEEAAFLLADNLHHEKTVNHAEPNILLRLQVVETRNVAAVTFPSPGETWLQPPPTRPSDPSDAPSGHPSTTSGDLDVDAVATSSSSAASSSSSSSSASFGPTNSLQDPEAPPPAPQDTITLPPEALLENSENGLVKMVFFSYDGLHHLLQPDGRSYRINEANFKGVNETRVLNSRVVSASLGAGRHIELPEPVVLTFTMIRTVNVNSPACLQDYTTSSWSEEGCRVLRYNTSHTVCQCDHLTNFAVLMDVHATPLAYPHHLALSIITYVGCVISIVCLLLATIVFHAFRGLKSDRTTIHKNLCVCLLIAETVFLAGVNQTDKPVVCGVVAGLLHFFFLAAFAWMFMEGFQLYVMLVEVFEAEKSRVRWYYGAAYGFPAVVVAVSAVVDPFSYGTKDACWLRADNYFIFAFVGPVIAVIIANSIFLTMSLFIMCRHANLSASVKNKEHTKLASVRSWVRGAVVLMFLLGLTWTFGLLYLNQASVVMAYVFTVLNSLQGLFIFIFHCVQNDKVKKELRRAGRRHPWLRACLCAAHERSQTGKDARASHNAASHSQSNSHSSHTLVPRLTSGRWTRGGSKNSTTTSSSQAGAGLPHLPAGASGTAAGGAGMGMGAGPVRAGSLSRASLSRGSLGRGSLSRASLSRTPQRNSSSRSARLHHHNLHTRTAALDHEDEKYSFKSCGRDSGHGGSEQEDSPRAGPAAKLAALRLNNNVAPHLPPDHLVNPFTTAGGAAAAAAAAGAAGHEQPSPGPEALLPDYRLGGEAPTLRLPSGAGARAHRTHSPWNHTYTEIPDGAAVGGGRSAGGDGGSDPVYEEIEREGRSELQVSDLSDEDGRRHSSDISRQSSRSYGDHRPLLPYTVPDRHAAPHHHQALPQYDPRLKARPRHPDGLDDSHTLPGGRLGPHMGTHMGPHMGPHMDHTVVSPGHILPMSHPAVTSAHALPPGNGHISGHQYMEAAAAAAAHAAHAVPGGQRLVDGDRDMLEAMPQYSPAVLSALGHPLPVVHPLSEPNLRNWEAAQRHRDLQQLQQLGEMTVAVLSGEQVVCKLKPPLAPIHENAGATTQVERHPQPPTYSHC
ncbi:latrophilin Cirl-like isoform X4 [Penaeus japonicus]|uniref:latrophilin Cirl-like isoform X4 n=1 Tax=Penaeus japonicus TaxID=27405 RepID=UPI001C710B91|nr:latrophilin Cirl-like isoform X4 [Penaeus japonicus]